jgi:signal transduction histidine kinase
MADIIFALDNEGRFTLYHAPETGALYPPLENLLGQKPMDVLPRTVAVLFADAFERATRGETTEFEYELTVNGKPHWYAAKLSPLANAAGFAGCVVVAREMTERVRQQRSLQDVQELLEQQVRERTSALERVNLKLQEEISKRKRVEEQLQQLAREAVNAQEQERRRLSQALHDEAGQALTTLKIGLELLEEDIPVERMDLRMRVVRCIDNVDEIVQLLRSLARNLRPPALDHVGLAPTLEAFCEEFAQRTQLSVSFRAADLPSLSEPAMICLYRCLQEALTNVARHANASWIKVELRNEDSGTCLVVEDDGRGFEVKSRFDDWTWGTGVGLLGMRERLEALGGRLEISSRPGQGTCLVARVPHQP